MGKTAINKDEFENIFRENYSRLYFLSRRYVDDEETARDIVSESFWAAWKNRNSIEKGKMSHYLYICVRNKSIKQTVNAKRTFSIDLHDDILTDDTFDEKWKESEQRYLEIEEEIAKMSPRTRFVLQQCYMENHTYKEVAAMLDITTDGVKKHIVKALDLLRKHFNKEKHK